MSSRTSALATNGNHSRELFALTEVAKALTAHLELTELLEAVMDRIDEALAPAEFGVLLLWDADDGFFRPRASCGPGIRDREALYAVELDQYESITGAVFSAGEPRFWQGHAEVAAAQANMTAANRGLMMQALTDTPPASIVAAPLFAGEHKYGVLLLGSFGIDVPFEAKDVSFIQTLADLIALAIDRARLEGVAALNQSARESERMRAEALATLSHELRTPLAAIKGYSTALLMDDLQWPEVKRHAFLQLIEDECDNLGLMLNDILDSSLSDIGQLKLSLEPCRFSRIAQEIAVEMGRRSPAHRLIVDFSSDFPIVDIDLLRMKQVLRNLIDNAIKYSPAGGMILIRGEARAVDVVVSVSDQGVGISPEDLIPLFEKYFRVKSATGCHVPGTGLGLPLARAIVEAHCGRIWAESKVGEGSTLYFSIPMPAANDSGD